MTVKERRKHPRRDLVGVVRYSGKPGVECTGIVDIGLGGIRLELSGSEKPGGRVQLQITVAPEDQPIDVLGQVVWARTAPPYEAGIRFLEVDATHLRRVL